MRKNATKLAAAVLSLAMVMTSVSMPASAAKKKTTKINKSTATLYTNGSKSQKSTTLYVTVGGKKVKATFKSSNTKILTVAKKTGKVTAKKPGKATVTATYKKKNYKCTVTVKAYATSVKVSPTTVSLVKGKTKVIKATVSPSNASNKKVSFKSSNKAVATVSSTGKITAKKAGTAKITVTALGSKNDAKKAYVTVKVTNPAPAATETPVVTETPAATETPVATVTPSAVATEGTITITSNVPDASVKVVSGTAVYAVGTAVGNSFKTEKLANGTYEVIVSKVGYEDVVVPVVVNGDVAVTAEFKVASLAVDSVKAINAKQIEVKFNNTMDRATVEKDANFDIKPMNTQDVNFPTRNNIYDITLQDDAKTAIITLKTAMTNGYEYEVTVNKEVKSAAGKNLAEKSVTKVVSNDSTRPTTTSIKTLAPNLLQVTFSEPVWIDAPSKNIEFVTVDSTGKELHDVLNPVVTGNRIVSASNGETSYVIKLDENLKQGSNYNLYVGGGNGISDFAGLKLTSEKHTFTYEADKEVTVVKNFTLLDGKTAKVSFTKPIDLESSNIKVYYNVDGVQGNQIAIGKVNESTDAQSIKVTFDKLIPGGVKYFFVDGACDLAGNKVEIGKFNITVPEYKAAEVSSVKLSNKTTIEVEFNQEIDDDKSYFNGDLTHDNKVRANIVLKDKDGKNVDIKNVELGKDSKNNNDYAKRIITLYKDLGEGNNTLTIDNLVDELGRVVVSYKGTVSYANSTEFSAKLKAGKTEDDNDKTVAVLSIDESKAVPTQASVENLKNWTVDTTYGKKTLAQVAGARVKMVSNDVYLVEADKNAFNTGRGSSVVLSNLETATGLTIPSTTVDAGDAVSDINELAKTKGDVSFDGTTATINLNNVIIGSFSPSDFIIVGTKEGANTSTTLTANEYTVSYSNNTAKDAFSSKIIIKFNNNVKIDKSKGITLKTAERTSTTDIFGRKLQANAAMTISDTSKAAVVGAYIAKTEAVAEINVNFDKDVSGTYDAKDFTVVTKDSKQALKVDSASASDKVLTLTLENLSGKAYADVLEKEEVSVSYTKKLSTPDKIASGMSATTNSLRLTKISFGTGASKEKVEKDETITFTYNKTLDQDLINNISDDSKPKKIKIGATGSNQTIETELGTFTMSDTNDLIGRDSSSVDGEVDADYKVSGNTIVITLTGLGDSKYENKITSKWVDSAVTYSDARSDFNTNDTYFDLATVRALDGTYAAVGDDDALSKASNLATGDMVSYADVEAALAKYDAAIKNIKVDGDFDAAEAAGAKAKTAVEKVPGGLAHTYYGDTGSGLLKIYNDNFKPYKEVHDVYKTLGADKLQSILNERTIRLPNNPAADLGLTGNNATIGYVCTASTAGGIGVVSANDAFVRPTASGAYNIVNVVVTISSSAKTLTMEFKVKVPYSGTIEVSKVGDATYGTTA